MVRDNKSLFDEAGQIALPYLVYAEIETRIKLANALAQITHNYIRRINEQLLPKEIELFLGMIEDYRTTAGRENLAAIDMYAAEISSLEDRFILLNEKVDDLIKKMKVKSKKSIHEDPKEVPKLNSDAQNTSIFKKELQETVKLNNVILGCLVCGKIVLKNGIDIKTNRQKYICDKRTGGCGKHFFEENGILFFPNAKGRPKITEKSLDKPTTGKPHRDITFEKQGMEELKQARTAQAEKVDVVTDETPEQIAQGEISKPEAKAHYNTVLSGTDPQKVPEIVTRSKAIEANLDKITKHLQINEEMTRQDVMTLCELTQPKAIYLLQKLMTKDIIVKTGKPRSPNTKYVLKKSAPAG